MYELNVKDISTFSNYPAPAKPEWFDRKLAELDGHTPDGRPRLRVVWGQEEKHEVQSLDEDGNLRVETHLKYLAARWVDSRMFHLYRNLTTGEVKQVTREEAESVYDKDPEWFYENRTSENVIEIGLPRWVIEQWNDSLHRYEEVFTVETRSQTCVACVKGQFCHRHGQYRPLGEDVLEEVRRRIYAREHYIKQTLEQIMKAAAEKRESDHAKQQGGLLDELTDEIRPHVHRVVGNPQVAMVEGNPEKQNLKTRHGRAKRVKVNG